MDDRLKQNETEERENRQKIWSRWSQLEVFQSNKEDKWLREKRKWMSFLTPRHLQCMCELGCVIASSVVRSLNADLHCRARRVTCWTHVSGNCCAVHSKGNQALKAERRALKVLLTPVSSTDHHLVPVLVVLPSYRTVLRPCLSESSKRWVIEYRFRGKHFCGTYFTGL